MTKDELIRDYRLDGLIRGTKPCYFILKKNPGNVYTKGTSSFIVTQSEDSLLFNKLSLFNKLKPSGNFKIDLKDIKEYAVVNNKELSVLYLYYDDKNFIPLVYRNKCTNDTQTEENVNKLILDFDNRGIKKIR